MNTTTAALAPHLEFQQLLPAHARRSLHLTQAVVALVATAVRDQGWTPKLLAQECGRDLAADVINAGAVITDRLRKAAAHPPPNKSTHVVTALCGRCEDGFEVDPQTRLPIRKCPCRTPNPGRTPR